MSRRPFALAAILVATATIACGGGSKNETASGETCGPKTCAKGQVCCNQSCGICTPPGGVCIQMFCAAP